MRLALAFALLAAPAFADSAASTCSHASDLARTIMEARQKGVPATKTINTVLPLVPEASSGLITDIVTAAYRQPRFNGAEYQQNAVSDFADEVYVACMDAF